MTALINAVSMFCDDVREEISHTETIVGVLPDNITVSRLPFAFPKLAVYTRVVVSVDFDVKPIEITLDFEGTEINKSELEEGLVRDAIESSRKAGSPIAGFVSRAISTPFPMERAGRLQVYVKAGNLSFVSGTLNIQQAPQGGG